ncbi:MAG TPA: trypsin-like peptidase domain-containing protein [Myxococcales bacterium]|nr:trypsin-like peptidase domain-containing protein [Myxococcales bacterium]
MVPLLLLASLTTAPSAARKTPLVLAVERARPAVVNINAQEVVRAPAANDPWSMFFGGRMRDQVRTSLGSGFVFDEKGFVLTNYHVVARGSRIQVSFADGSDFTARVVGTDPGGDLAVLRIQAERTFPAAPLGISSDLMLGEPAVAIGNPFGLNQSVSIGVVSALHRPVHAEDRSYYDFIQTDASINPGNSGGPLINADGNVIGVCSAVLASGQGIGFAIPIDRALRVARELQKSGALADAWWGFEAESLDKEAAAALGARAGALVTSVEEGSPAAGAGLRRGDAIVRVEGTPVGDADELRFLLRDIPLGTRVDLGVLRGKGKVEVSVTPAPLTSERALGIFESRSGLKVSELSIKEARSAGYDVQKPVLAVQAVSRNSAAARVGLRRGDLVLSVNSAEVDTMKEFEKALSQARKSGRAVLLVQRGYRLQEFAFDLG